MRGVRDGDDPLVRWEEIDQILSAQGSLDRVTFALGKTISSDQFDRLAVTVEADIIPRLMLLHRAEMATPPPAGRPPARVNEADIASLTDLVLLQDAAPALDYVAGLVARGAAVEAILLELLSPVARRLGQMWDEDERSFIEVTTGLARLQQLLRVMGSAVGGLGDRGNRGLRALFAPAPGERHNFGIFVVEQFFRYDGWTVEVAPQLSTTEIAEAVRGDWFSVLGFSLSCAELAGRLAVTIDRARSTSANPDVKVLVGGHAFIEDPDLVWQVGADAMAEDGRDAVAKAHALPLAAVRHA